MIAKRAIIALAALLAIGGRLETAPVTIEPSGDKYMYPFINDSPDDGGSRRDYGSVFGAYGAIDDPSFNFDDRDAQFFLDFATQSLAPAGQGASKYRVLSLTVTLVVENEGGFVYDPTFDPLPTYLNPDTDIDLGRPLELYGVGYRSGWTRATFDADSPFQSIRSSSVEDPQGDWNRKRNAFAIDFDALGAPRDISNNVEENFETSPWAVADSPGFIGREDDIYVESPIEPGSLMPEGRVLRFQVDPNNPRVAAYLQDALHAGRLHLMVSSLYGTQRQSSSIPRFYSKEIGLPELTPQLSAEVLVMPETTIARVPNGYRVHFDTVAGQNYQVERRDSLSTGNWLPVGEPRQGTGDLLDYTDTTAGSSSTGHRFYRVSVSKTQST
jgi:hypothetical protein